MDKKEHVLSGEEALNEYFTALLEEEVAEEVAYSEPLAAPVAEPVPVYEEFTEATESSVAVSEPTPEVKLQPDYHSSYTELEFNEFEVPDLDDVQKLLDKLESTDLADVPEVVTIIEQNTVDIAKSEPVVEEIQEWDVTEVSEEVTVVEAQPDEVVAQSQEIDSEATIETDVQLEPQAGGFAIDDWENRSRSEDFQVLYFDVNGVTFAVPLDELGGIHRKGEMSHLIGRPGWYLGLQTNKEDQLDVVDTAKWVMADRLRDDSYKEAYQYIVMLGLSNWGLASTELKGTETLNADNVRWREQAGKRPWLAGMVKEKMCALIHVDALITMLNAGLDVKSLDS